MYNPNYEFCDELDAPEMCIVMNTEWWCDNRKDIAEFLDLKVRKGSRAGTMFCIPEPADRTYFMLRWPQ
jgi:hypothetical protein